jgi:hypothetical protein
MPEGVGFGPAPLLLYPFPLGGQASGKDDGEQPKWMTTSSMFQTV